MHDLAEKYYTGSLTNSEKDSNCPSGLFISLPTSDFFLKITEKYYQ